MHRHVDVYEARENGKAQYDLLLSREPDELSTPASVEQLVVAGKAEGLTYEQQRSQTKCATCKANGNCGIL